MHFGTQGWELHTSTNSFGCLIAHTFDHNGNHEALPFASAWVSRRDCKRPVSGWRLETVPTSPPTKRVGKGFKRVATLHPESEKQDDTQGIQTNNIEWDNQTKPEVNQKSIKDQLNNWINLPAPNPTKQGPKQLRMPNVSVGTASQTITSQKSLGWYVSNQVLFPVNKKGKKIRQDQVQSKQPTSAMEWVQIVELVTTRKGRGQQLQQQSQKV